MLVFVEHLPHFVSALSCRDVQLKHRHCQNRNTKYVTTFPPYQLGNHLSLSVYHLSSCQKEPRAHLSISHLIQYNEHLFNVFNVFVHDVGSTAAKHTLSQPWARRHEVIVVRYLEQYKINICIASFIY